MSVVSQQLDHFIVRFSPARDLATKGGKTFTKACGSISSPKSGIGNEVSHSVRSTEDLRISLR